MPISTYADLKSAVADWLERSDLAGRIPDFITLAESRLNRLFRGRMSEVNTTLAASAGVRIVALPGGFSEAVSVRLAGCVDPLRFVDPGLIEARTDAGQPRYWTIDGGALVFERPTDKAYAVTLRHLRKFVLSDAEPSNPILADYPDLYLFGALLEAAPFLRDADLLALFQTRFDAALREANAKEHENRARAQLRGERGLVGQGAYSIRAG
jgi:hypothetical protein